MDLADCLQCLAAYIGWIGRMKVGTGGGGTRGGMMTEAEVGAPMENDDKDAQHDEVAAMGTHKHGAV